ncbi:MAG: tRNA pseudouridine(38-40) synthase TruA [Candidatus Methanomethylophilus sp.]|jgi:tRNA pseudouridine38-40 synthase|nr:tRNA pseudouridine(38-40) synthase TruA [Methanomethylophilus sp.]MCI2075063.1 tRNA pseudouridine(38-40) synthase TruA [Methanomethylophilus sp.]MCI2092405.1 tRNA pseudouridine(38-40) synthase TruA [Methanomethylophilus sp.]
MRRYLVKVAYLGEGFSGSQAQPPETGLRTVAGEVRSKLLLTDHVPEDRIDLRFASRTDAGVSALGNAIAFYTEFKDPETMLRALNSVSDGVYYLAYREVDDAFNPRIADKRYYRYSCPADRMDLPAFREAAELFEGHHDFKRFAKNETGKSTVMAIDSVDVRLRGNIIETDFCANYFLWNQIRRIMAAVMQVGLGMSSLQDVKEILAGRDGTFGLAKPEGLTLLDVTFPGEGFTFPEECPYSRRIGRDLFRDGLRSGFHRTLMDRYREETG